jgi:hypothetical protein
MKNMELYPLFFQASASGSQAGVAELVQAQISAFRDMLGGAMFTECFSVAELRAVKRVSLHL